MIQDTRNGKVLATVIPASNCPKSDIATLINTVGSLVPVLAHPTNGKHSFTHDETVGADNRRVDTVVLAGRVESTVHHHFYSRDQKHTIGHMAAMSDGLTQKTHETTHLDGNSFTK